MEREDISKCIRNFLTQSGLTTSDLREYCDITERRIGHTWGIEDIQKVNREEGHAELDDEVAYEILLDIAEDYDAFLEHIDSLAIRSAVCEHHTHVLTYDAMRDDIGV